MESSCPALTRHKGNPDTSASLCSSFPEDLRKKVHISSGGMVIGDGLSWDRLGSALKYCKAPVLFLWRSGFWLCKRSEPLLRKWNCFDTLVVLLQWADYAAEMMPGKLVQSGNLGYLSAFRANLLQRFTAIFWQFRTPSDVPRNVFANAAPGAYHAFGTCHWLAKNRELKNNNNSFVGELHRFAWFC